MYNKLDERLYLKNCIEEDIKRYLDFFKLPNIYNSYLLYRLRLIRLREGKINVYLILKETLYSGIKDLLRLVLFLSTKSLNFTPGETKEVYIIPTIKGWPVDVRHFMPQIKCKNVTLISVSTLRHWSEFLFSFSKSVAVIKAFIKSVRLLIDYPKMIILITTYWVDYSRFAIIENTLRKEGLTDVYLWFENEMWQKFLAQSNSSIKLYSDFVVDLYCYSYMHPSEYPANNKLLMNEYLYKYSRSNLSNILEVSRVMIVPDEYDLKSRYILVHLPIDKVASEFILKILRGIANWTFVIKQHPKISIDLGYFEHYTVGKHKYCAFAGSIGSSVYRFYNSGFKCIIIAKDVLPFPINDWADVCLINGIEEKEKLTNYLLKK